MSDEVKRLQADLRRDRAEGLSPPEERQSFRRSSSFGAKAAEKLAEKLACDAVAAKQLGDVDDKKFWDTHVSTASTQAADVGRWENFWDTHASTASTQAGEMSTLEDEGGGIALNDGFMTPITSIISSSGAAIPQDSLAHENSGEEGFQTPSPKWRFHGCMSPLAPKDKHKWARTTDEPMSPLASPKDQPWAWDEAAVAVEKTMEKRASRMRYFMRLL